MPALIVTQTNTPLPVYKRDVGRDGGVVHLSRSRGRHATPSSSSRLTRGQRASVFALGVIICSVLSGSVSLMLSRRDPRLTNSPNIRLGVGDPRPNPPATFALSNPRSTASIDPPAAAAASAAAAENAGVEAPVSVARAALALTAASMLVVVLSVAVAAAMMRGAGPARRKGDRLPVREDYDECADVAAGFAAVDRV